MAYDLETVSDLKSRSYVDKRRDQISYLHTGRELYGYFSLLSLEPHMRLASTGAPHEAATKLKLRRTKIRSKC